MRGPVYVVVLWGCLACAAPAAEAQQTEPVGVGEWLTVSANIDGGFRATQLFRDDYDTSLLGADARVELWFPPFRNALSWGPYLRIAAIGSSRDQPWENAWLGAPGVGFQVFPFSSSRARRSSTGKVLGPTRLFAEYDVVHYWGAANSWRPTRQKRVGLDYWRASYVNSHARPWWAETWNGLWWQSSNEFNERYNSVIAANVARLGLRKPSGGVASIVTPYGVVESSWSSNDKYYWENRLLVGGGVRFAPVLQRQRSDDKLWITRFVVYGEYVRAAAYYRAAAPSSNPRFDFRLGVSTSIGDWYK